MEVRFNKEGAATDFLSCAEADEKERRLIIQAYKQIIEGKDDQQSVMLTASAMPLTSGSSFDYVHTPVSQMLAEIATSELLADKFNYPVQYYRVACSSEGHLQAVGPNDSIDLTAILATDPVLSERLAAIAELVKEIGGEVNLGPVTTYDCWLRFHGLTVPETVEQAKKVLFFLEWEWPATDGLDNYWQQITGADQHSVVLTTEQYAHIRELTGRFFPDGEGVLQALYRNGPPNPPMHIDEDSANEVLTAVLNQPYSKALAKRYIDALGWYGSADDETLHDADLAQMLVTVILIDLDPLLGNHERRNHVGTYDLYAPDVAADQPMQLVREGLEDYLVKNGRVSQELSPVAAHLLLGFIAPGFVVKFLPRGLAVGSITWLSFVQAVALIEIYCKGASRFMTYEQVMMFSDMDAISQQFGQLQGIAAMDSIFDWALINEVINADELQEFPEDAQQRALSSYEDFTQGLTHTARTFSTPLPSRRKLALAALEKAAPGCYFLDNKVLRHETDKFSSSYQMSILDLHIEGELTGREWDWREAGSLYDTYPDLKWLEPNQPIFERAVRAYESNLREAMISNIKLAISKMPIAHRNIFATHEITFFTVRTSVSEKVYENSNGLIGGNVGKPKWMEKQIKRDEATGRYAVILCAPFGDGEFLCYEMFYLKGACRLNEQLGNLISRTGMMDIESRIDFKGDLKAYLPAFGAYNYPLDFDSYTNGTAPVSKPYIDTVLNKLGVLAAPADPGRDKTSAFQSFINPHINEIAEFLTRHHPIATVTEIGIAATELTEREQVQDKSEKALAYIIDLAIPFKKCIEDINSGEKDKLEEGLWGCGLDLVGVIAVFMGAPGKVMHISAKVVPLSLKIARFARLALQLTISLFNPIDGLPTAAYKGMRFALKGTQRLGTSGLRLVEGATFQMRRLTGKARSVDLIQASSRADFCVGTWRPIVGGSQTMSVCAVRQSRGWYAINQSGRAWGKRLADFAVTQMRALPKLRHSLPKGFARQIIQRSLPVANRKVDQALKALAMPYFNRETELTINLLLGGSGKTREKMEFVLQAAKLEFGVTVVENFILKNDATGRSIIELSRDDYRKWKGADRPMNQPFFTVDTQNLVERFNSAKSRFGEVADDLIHEMFKTELTMPDAAWALTGASNQQTVDVAPLLNLAKGFLIKSPDSSSYFDKRRAVSNADSYAVATALLSQLVTHEAQAKDNLYLMVEAIGKYEGRAIDTPVLINLNID